MTDPSPEQGSVDVCLVVEGCYPFIAGGVSSWLDWLIRSQPELTFGVVAITADAQPREPKFESPPNLRFIHTLPLAYGTDSPIRRQPKFDEARMITSLRGIFEESDLDAFKDLIALAQDPIARRGFLGWGNQSSTPTRKDLLDSQASWNVMQACYNTICPQASFIDFFWAWRNLMGSVFSVLTAPIPPAKTYHAISTGYAGLFAARAAMVAKCPLLITEHGIYTNERRIDLIMAEWIADSIDQGLGGRDPRVDVRDFWIKAFNAFATIAYRAADKVTTLYAANQSFQRELGAIEDTLRVIPNGIMLEKFDAMKKAPPKSSLQVALIGRVVPIKDIETMISAAALVRARFPSVEILIMGPTDEDPAYFETCKQAVADLNLGETVIFTGRVNIFDHLPEIDLLVLSSISEAQPLVLLEAGAARIPCVATDVGSCREIIEGAVDEHPNLGPAGRIVPAMNPNALAKAIVELLDDSDLRRTCGETLRRRVELYFTSEASQTKYNDLYQEALAS